MIPKGCRFTAISSNWENERLKGQVNKILELARLENREIILRKEPINLRQAALEEIVPPFMVQLEARKENFTKSARTHLVWSLLTGYT